MKHGSAVVLKMPQINLLRRLLNGERFTDSTGKYLYRDATGDRVQRDLVIQLHALQFVRQSLVEDELILEITDAGRAALQGR